MIEAVVFFSNYIFSDIKKVDDCKTKFWGIRNKKFGKSQEFSSMGCLGRFFLVKGGE